MLRLSALKSTKESLTIAWLIVTASGPSLRTVSSMLPGCSSVRSIASSSTGGPLRLPSPGPSSSAKAAITAAIRTSGISPSSQAGAVRGRRLDAAGPLRRSARLHQEPTSKKPIQPSCANSDWCAWNMNLPSYGNRSSRMPRCPWHCMIVSVYSTGSSDVPVGK